MAEFGHGLPEWWIQEHLAHHMTLQDGGMMLKVAQELLPNQVQVFTEHVNVQIIPGQKEEQLNKLKFILKTNNLLLTS